jgi:RNA polymerase sigma factor (sigma-70 family)
MIDALLHEEAVLLSSANIDDVAAIGELFAKEQVALEQFVANKLNRRLASRLDARDVVQDVFVLALGRLPAYLKSCVPFPVWLHAIAVERLGKIHEIHVKASKHSVYCETEKDEWHEIRMTAVSTGMASTPDVRLSCEFDNHELYERVRILENELPQCDQDLLRLRIFEERPINEVAMLLRIKRGAVCMRQNRILHRLRVRLDAELAVEEHAEPKPRPWRVGMQCHKNLTMKPSINSSTNCCNGYAVENRSIGPPASNNIRSTPTD